MALGLDGDGHALAPPSAVWAHQDRSTSTGSTTKFDLPRPARTEADLVYLPRDLSRHASATTLHPGIVECEVPGKIVSVILTNFEIRVLLLASHCPIIVLLQNYILIVVNKYYNTEEMGGRGWDKNFFSRSLLFSKVR